MVGYSGRPSTVLRFGVKTAASNSHAFTAITLDISGGLLVNSDIFFFSVNHRESLHGKRDEHFIDEIESQTITILLAGKKIPFGIKASNSTSRS